MQLCFQNASACTVTRLEGSFRPFWCACASACAVWGQGFYFAYSPFSTSLYTRSICSTSLRSVSLQRAIKSHYWRVFFGNIWDSLLPRNSAIVSHEPIQAFQTPEAWFPGIKMRWMGLLNLRENQSQYVVGLTGRFSMAWSCWGKPQFRISDLLVSIERLKHSSKASGPWAAWETCLRYVRKLGSRSPKNVFVLDLSLTSEAWLKVITWLSERLVWRFRPPKVRNCKIIIGRTIRVRCMTLIMTFFMNLRRKGARRSRQSSSNHGWWLPSTCSPLFQVIISYVCSSSSFLLVWAHEYALMCGDEDNKIPSWMAIILWAPAPDLDMHPCHMHQHSLALLVWTILKHLACVMLFIGMVLCIWRLAALLLAVELQNKHVEN